MVVGYFRCGYHFILTKERGGAGMTAFEAISLMITFSLLVVSLISLILGIISKVKK
jgi:hypothetical protein